MIGREVSMTTSFLVAAIGCLPAWACTLDAGQEHRPSARYHFKTQSYVRPASPLPIGVTCVHNLTSDWIEVHWFIPGGGGWVPPNELSPPWERYLRAKQHQTLEGCLEYGNVGETTKAIVEGDSIEYEMSLEEKRKGCRAARDEYHSAAITGDLIEEIVPLSIPVKTLFPSDSNQPAKTMLVLSGEVKVVPKEGMRYSVQFNVQISKYDGSELADSTKIYVRPNFDDRVSSLRSVFSEYIGNLLPIEKLPGTQIDFMAMEGNLSIERASLDVVSEAGRILARVSFPVYIAKG